MPACIFSQTCMCTQTPTCVHVWWVTTHLLHLDVCTHRHTYRQTHTRVHTCTHVHTHTHTPFLWETLHSLHDLHTQQPVKVWCHVYQATIITLTLTRNTSYGQETLTYGNWHTITLCEALWIHEIITMLTTATLETTTAHNLTGK